MNQAQVKYVRQRIEDIFIEKKAAIRAKYLWVKPTLTLEEKIKRIKNDEFVITDNRHYYGQSLDSCLKFVEEENENLKLEAEAHDKLRKERVKLLDNLMLGDAEQVLEALNKFEKEIY